MAGSLNKVMLIGNLGKDPEFRAFEGGGSLTRFPIATSETYVSKQTNQKVENTEWHNIVLRNKLGEIADKYLKKGDSVFIEGRLKTRSWEDNSGEKKYTTEIIAENMTMLGSPKGGASQEESGTMENEQPKQNDATFNEPAEEEDDLPF